MSYTRFVKIEKNKIQRDFKVYSLLSHSIQDWQIVVKEFNSLSYTQRKSIVQKEKLLEKILKEKMITVNEDMFFTCSMVNLNIVASQYDIDPNTVCMCIDPMCKLNENILVV